MVTSACFKILSKSDEISGIQSRGQTSRQLCQSGNEGRSTLPAEIPLLLVVGGADARLLLTELEGEGGVRWQAWQQTLTTSCAGC